MRMIVANAGREGSVVVEMVRRLAKERNDKNIGYDVLANEYVDMLKQGIIDPAKVTRSALENAASVGGMILTTEALVTDIPEKAPAAMPQMPEY